MLHRPTSQTSGKSSVYTSKISTNKIFTNASANAAFTLVQMAILVLAIGITIAVVLETRQTEVVSKQRESDIKNLQKIEQALIAFRKIYNRLPCPADITLAIGNADYGKEADEPGDCTGGTIEANFFEAAGDTVAGGVPTRALSLADEEGLDGFNNKFTYVVDKRMTAENSFSTHPQNDTTIGSIQINDLGGNTLEPKAVYTIITHGKNAHGGYSAAGNRIARGSTNAAELENCDCDGSTAASNAFNNVFIKSARLGSETKVADNFDDVLTYRNRAGFHTSQDIIATSAPAKGSSPARTCTPSCDACKGSCGPNRGTKNCIQADCSVVVTPCTACCIPGTIYGGFCRTCLNNCNSSGTVYHRNSDCSVTTRTCCVACNDGQGGDR